MMSSESLTKVLAAEASAWRAISTFATLAHREFKLLPTSDKHKLLNVELLLTHIVSRKTAVSELIDRLPE